MPDSEYMEREERPRRGLFDFLPFIGGRTEPVPPEDLSPSPQAEEPKPALAEADVRELRVVAERWILTSEFTEPTVRRNPEGKFYRDYIVFDSEYRVEVLKGEDEETPFVAFVYVNGDYFSTEPHETAAEAESDYNFAHDSLQFRLVFHRVEKWEYSYSPNEPPITFKETWEFRKLQSRSELRITESDTEEEEPSPTTGTPSPSGGETAP